MILFSEETDSSPKPPNCAVFVVPALFGISRGTPGDRVPLPTLPLGEKVLVCPNAKFKKVANMKMEKKSCYIIMDLLFLISFNILLPIKINLQNFKNLIKRLIVIH